MQDAKEFSLRELLHHFATIYRHCYYQQDLWKVGMHLSEEVGEATIELSRIDLSWRAQKSSSFDIREELQRTFRSARGMSKENTDRIANDQVRREWRSKHESLLATLEAEVEGNPWPTYDRLVTEKFKEEIADVFSWLAAIIWKLDPTHDLATFGKLADDFKAHEDGMDFLACLWCKKRRCKDGCLVSHGLAREMVESVSKF